MKENPLVKRWIEKSVADLDVAKVTFKETRHYGMVCFLSQQAVEKYLKAYLVFKKIEFQKIHSLVELTKLALKGNSDFADWVDEGKILDKYYIPTRYPVSWEQIYNKKDARNALEIAENFIVFIKKNLK